MNIIRQEADKPKPQKSKKVSTVKTVGKSSKKETIKPITKSTKDASKEPMLKTKLVALSIITIIVVILAILMGVWMWEDLRKVISPPEDPLANPAILGEHEMPKKQTLWDLFKWSQSDTPDGTIPYEFDENGNPIENEIIGYDDNGNPIYRNGSSSNGTRVNSNGTAINSNGEEEEVVGYDANGNPVFASQATLMSPGRLTQEELAELANNLPMGASTSANASSESGGRESAVTGNRESQNSLLGSAEQGNSIAAVAEAPERDASANMAERPDNMVNPEDGYTVYGNTSITSVQALDRPEDVTKQAVQKVEIPESISFPSVAPVQRPDQMGGTADGGSSSGFGQLVRPEQGTGVAPLPISERE